MRYAESLMVHSHPTQLGTVHCTSPHQVSPLPHCPFLSGSWLQLLPQPLLSHPCPGASLCPLLMPSLTIQPLLPCCELPPFLHFCSPKSQVSSLSPPPFSFSHTNMGFILLAHQWQNAIFFTRNQFSIDYEYRIRAHYSTKHRSSGCFAAQKNTNFQWIIYSCM